MVDESQARPSVSVRQRLMSLGEQAALATHGVASLHPLSDPGQAVRCAAQPDGRYELRIALTARPVALHKLGATVRDAVLAGATEAGLQDELGLIDIEICDVVSLSDGGRA